MKVASLFTGVGGFDLGLERSGMRVLWQVEFDEQCQSVLRHRFPETEIYGDVREVGAEQLGPVSLICGGFPCQDLSVAGKRAGLDGDRSGLWHEFHRIISEIAPRWVLIENVPGLLSSNDGRDMGVVVRGLEELGYGWAYRVLDSQYFGVAQRRRRVFIVGHLGTAEPAIRTLFPVGTGLPGDTTPSRETGERPAASTADIPATCGTLSDGAHMGGGLNGQDAYTGRIIPSQSVPRRLTPLECERLQGFPDDWTLIDHKGKPMSDGPRYRMMGNAVTVNVAEWIGKNIMEQIG